MDDRKEGVSASGNFLTYAQTALDTWNERPFCAVDSLVLSWLAYYRLPADCPSVNTWEGIDVRDLLRLECREPMTGGAVGSAGQLGLAGRRVRQSTLSRHARMRLSYGV